MIHINLKEKCLVNSENGDIVRPTCWDHLAPYHSMLCGRGHKAAAQSLLEDVFRGEKVITKMIEKHQKHFGEMETEKKLD